MKKLLIVDGNSILNRAFYGIRPLTTGDGLPTNAVYGFITILKKHLDALHPDYLACAFDLKAPTFRHKMYDGYKANRKPMPEELAAQLPYAKEVAAAMGFKVIVCEGWEADDILGTVAGEGDRLSDVHSYILTGDRDSLQLITDNTSVILVKTKEDIVYTPKSFFEEYGITPTQFIDVKALMGDTSDNIPGVAGIGEKTALKLIIAAGSLDGLYADEKLGGAGKSACQKLLEGKENAYMSYKLAKISREAPIDCSISDMENNGGNREELSRLFTRLEFTALYKRFGLDGDDTPAEAPEAPGLSPMPEKLKIPYAVDYNEDGLFICDGEGIYKSEISESLFSEKIICHDLKTLYKEMTKKGVSVDCLFDTQSASYLLSPGESAYPVEKSVVRHLSEQPRITAESRVWYIYRLYAPLCESIEKAGMSKLLSDVEMPLSPVLADMETEGFYLDCEGLHSYTQSLIAMQNELSERIYMQAGREFNINSPKQLGEVLFDELGLPVKKKTKTGYSTDAETLESLRYSHPIIGDILDFRQVTKLSGTYGENLISLADEHSKIHTVFNQTGTATGRLSSTDPNMQNIPVRGELGRELRSFFTASSPDRILIDADYSQIELRLLAEISEDETMQELFRCGEDIHTATAATVFSLPKESVTKELRSRAKAVNFGIVYGIGAYSLSQDIHVSLKAAKEYIESYLAAFPGVAAYLKNTVEKAKKDGYTKTAYGRVRPIPELSAKNKNLQAFGERVAMNSPIQGTAADVIKLAMINVAKALKEAELDAHLILQVHDELIVEASKKDAEAAAQILSREMENAQKGSVPLTVDVGMGNTWLEAH